MNSHQIHYFPIKKITFHRNKQKKKVNFTNKAFKNLKTQTGTSQIDNFPIKTKKANNFPQKQTKPRRKFKATTTKKEGKRRETYIGFELIDDLQSKSINGTIIH
jgi:hypothetical protein